ncbi:glycosyltransferase [Priestia megaterium]|uniref:glycosyltransferase n=1 Tax=Priestia megaterium TaxID=1404 RepID=UPI001F12C0BA|nr:glycosyltransferase [Priestia megaterium]UMZ34200.1 glycosyltransferase family 4 protein [Priestia megaterium]
MRGLFIHDHKFPLLKHKYYHSYGFDREFFNRYLSMFDELAVIGRHSHVEISSLNNSEEVCDKVDFFTIGNLKDLRSGNLRKRIAEEIVKSDFLVIRVPSILGLYAVRMAIKYHKPFLIEVVGCAWDAIANKGFTKIIPAAVITYMMKRALRSAEYAVYVTEEFLEKRYPTQGKYIACSNVTLNSVEDVVLKERLSRIKSLNTNNKVVLGTCATVDVVYKGQQDVIAAIAKLKSEGHNIEYQLVGGGNTSYLKSIAEKYNVTDNVKFVGSLRHEEVFSWLDNIDVYVHPSKQEGLSRAIIEAMSRGCPIFGADAGGIHELIEKEYIFPKGDVQEICDIYNTFDKENMMQQARKNHENSKRYVKSVLYERRNNFFNNFIQEAGQQVNRQS